MRRHFSSFAEFYPFYLAQHRNRTCRLLHLGGLILALASLGIGCGVHSSVLLAGVPLFGYGPGWIGHFVFEHNKPAAFGHPFYSLIGDFRMALDTLRGRL